jgi:hypothetical protein
MSDVCPKKCSTPLGEMGECKVIDCPFVAPSTGAANLLTAAPTNQLLVTRVPRYFAISNEALRALLAILKESGAEDLDGELAREFCSELLRVANVNDWGGCPLCRG